MTESTCYAAQCMTIKQICADLKMSRWTLVRLVKSDPTFPRFFNLSPGKKVVAKSELEHWFRAKQVKSVAGK